MKLYCRNGHTYKTREFRRAPDETHCPEPGCALRLETGMEQRARERASRTGGRLRDRSSAEVEASREFHRLVCEWPCWALKHRPCEVCKGEGATAVEKVLHGVRSDEWVTCTACHGDGKHHCRGLKNAHHLVPLDWLRDTFGDLPEGDFLAIAFAPIIGAPACQHNFHASLEVRSDYIYFDELDPELIDFCQRTEAKYPDRPSILARLEMESPHRQTEAAAAAGRSKA